MTTLGPGRNEREHNIPKLAIPSSAMADIGVLDILRCSGGNIGFGSQSCCAQNLLPTVINDTQIRVSAFDHIKALKVKCGGPLPWTEISKGVHIGGEHFFLSGRARGIFRPRQMRRGVLSIKSTEPRVGRMRRYDDIASNEGFFEYRFMGDNPEAPDNRWLREAWKDQSPFIYFHGIIPSVYDPIFPVFVSEWIPERGTVRVVVGEIDRTGAITSPITEDLRRYRVIETKARLHQTIFRETVLAAYDRRCAISAMPVERFLEAAHILADRDERGLPVVSNGISMSVLHHTAFDANLMGIDPDGKIHINRDLLEIVDGPTLQYALQNLDGEKIKQPARQDYRPNKDFLAERFEQFKTAA